METVAILKKLEGISTDLSSLHRELATVLAAEKAAKVDAYKYSEANTLRGRDMDADIASVDFAVEVYKIKGEIAAQTEYRDYLRILLDHYPQSPNGIPQERTD